MSATRDSTLADPQELIADLRRQLAEALERETATAEVLQVINSSPGNLQPVFDAILEKAHTLCGTEHGSLVTYDGKSFRAVACRGVPEPFEKLLRGGFPLVPGAPPELLVRGEDLVHILDLAAFVAKSPPTVAEVLRPSVEFGTRTILLVPLRKDQALLGYIAAYRLVVRPFTEPQIALLQNFAAQAVIAMENARLVTETREALEQQTATAEVLGVINSSPGDLAPVFDAILDKAHALCGVALGELELYANGKVHAVAVRGVTGKFADLLREPFAPPPGSPPARLLAGEAVVQIADVAELAREQPDDPRAQAGTQHGLRTALFVPLRKDGALLGYITGYRREVRPFSEREITLLQNFAAQAVIAIDNTRLIIETREALEQQTATAEVLGVINASPGDLTPVFDAVLEKALFLCGGAFGVLNVFDGERFNGVAMRGVPPAFAEFRQGNPAGTGPGTAPARILAGENVVHNLDLKDEEPYRRGDPYRRAIVDLGGARSHLAVALRTDSALRGMLTIYRQEVRAFSVKEIALLQNFAAQAVIAMENARLITETREALGQQTATAEVLQVINSSPGNLAPVFNTMLAKAMRLCEAAFGVLLTYDGEAFHAVAEHGIPEAFSAFLQQPLRPALGNSAFRLVNGETVVQILDLLEDEANRYGDPARRAVVEKGGARTQLLVTLRKEQVLLGAFAVYRQEVRAFTDKQIALLQNFAAQAVIAMENARLITETREALEQQTATSEVLGAINSSPGDLVPVFDAMLEKAIRLCEGTQGTLWTFAEDRITLAASRGLSPEFVELLRDSRERHDPGGQDPVRRVLNGEKLIQVLDLTAESTHGPVFRAAGEFGGVKTIMVVGLFKEETPLGAFVISRREVRAFTDKQIALLQNFAAQAVIAMENARLLTETREALEQQTATADVLGVINSSPGNLGPVFDAMLEKATRLCEGVQGVLWRIDGEKVTLAATHQLAPGFIDMLRRIESGKLDTPPQLRQIMQGDRLVHVADVAEHELYRADDPRAKIAVDLGHVRTLVWVALVKDNVPMGAFAIARREVRPFTDKQIALLQNFAAQAVIAMENARLITETREALQQQTATAEVLQVINSSPGDLAPVFDTILEKAHSLCGAELGTLFTYDGKSFWPTAASGVSERFGELMRGGFHPGAANPFSCIREGAPLLHIADIRQLAAQHPGDTGLQVAVEIGLRTFLIVPLRKDDMLLGVITANRREVRPFSDSQIALLQSFAAQAVIAMENARLLDEIRQRQAELRVTFDNMADGVAMFDQTLHLAAWNRNFQELLDLPDDLLVPRPAFDDYIRYLTERGEFGATDPKTEIARLRSRLGDHYSFERSRPDGTVVEVRNNPMPDGGVVVIYSDITERKRSEAEIRAARDAAEAAYHDLQAAQANLVQAQKMAALGQLTAGIAHEIKNPLNFVNNFASLSNELLEELKAETKPALAALDDDKRAEIDETMVMLSGNLEKIVEHGQRADNIVKGMLEHSRGVSGERREVDLNALIEDALNLAYHGARAQDANFNVTLARDYAPTLGVIEVAPQEMTRVFLNLFGNGFYAASKRAQASGDGSFRPILAVATCDDGNAVEVRVRDNGTGISPEIKDKLFQPFFTTKPTGEGTGLGLSISYDIITQQHGGTITVESEPGAFTEFTVRLPRH